MNRTQIASAAVLMAVGVVLWATLGGWWGKAPIAAAFVVLLAAEAAYRRERRIDEIAEGVRRGRR